MNEFSATLRESALWLRSVLEIHGDADTLTLAGASGTSVYTRGHGLDLHVGADKFHYPESALDGEKWELASAA
jgi:hypothetical protein